MQEITVRGNQTYISLTRGDSFYSVVSMEKDGEPYIPVEGDSLRFAMKKNFSDTAVALEKSIPIDSLLLAIAPSDTKDLGTGDYVFDIELTTAGGDVDTFIRGVFTLEKEVK